MHDIQHYSFLKNYFTIIYINICISIRWTGISKKLHIYFSGYWMKNMKRLPPMPRYRSSLWISKEKDEQVSYLVKEDQIFIYCNQVYIKKERLKYYHFKDFYLMILKDMLYE